MKEYDVVVIGSGAGMNVAADAYNQGMTVAVVEHGPMGGTCLNRGCIPTKMLTYPADLIADLEESAKLNFTAKIEKIDFAGLMERTQNEVGNDSQNQGRSIDAAENFDWYKETGRFIKDYTIETGSTEITAPLIFIASGARPFLPPIQGLEKVPYFTSKTVLDLRKPPASMIIIGGGYIAAEYGHFFAAMGTKVTIIGRNPSLVKNEDPDVSQLLKQELSKRMTVITGHETQVVKQEDGKIIATAVNIENENKVDISGESLLIAAGRIPNSDLVQPEKTGVETDEHGFIKVDDFFRTTKDGIWAFGDAIGRHMFRHVANQEAGIVWHNVTSAKKGEEKNMTSMRYNAVPRAVFSRPQIATVGMTLREALQTKLDGWVGRANYADVAKGMAMGYPEGFVRVLADGKTRQLLGATVIGPHAAILIHEIINLMHTNDRSFIPVLRSMHIHPALSEVVQRAVGQLAPIHQEHQHNHAHHPPSDA